MCVCVFVCVCVCVVALAHNTVCSPVPSYASQCMLYALPLFFTQPYGPPFDETFEEENKTVEEWRSKLFSEQFNH